MYKRVTRHYKFLLNLCFLVIMFAFGSTSWDEFGEGKLWIGAYMHLPWGYYPGRLEGSRSCHCRWLQRHYSRRHCAGSASSAGQSSYLWWLKGGGEHIHSRCCKQTNACRQLTKKANTSSRTRQYKSTTHLTYMYQIRWGSPIHL